MVVGMLCLPQVAQLKLSRKKLEDLYEQVVLEMIELRELDTARSILRQTHAVVFMKQEQPGCCLRLEHPLVRTFFDPGEVLYDMLIWFTVSVLYGSLDSKSSGQ